MRLGQTSVVFTATRVGASALGFLTTVYFAQTLGETVLGQYALLLALVSWLGLVGKAGLSKALIKRFSEGEDRTAFLGAAISVLAGLFVITATGVVLFAPQVNRYIGADVFEFVILFVLLDGLTTLSKSALQGNRLVHVSSLLSLAERVIRSIAQVLFVVVGFELVGLLLGYALSTSLAGVVGIVYLGIRPSLPGRKHVVSLLNFAKYAWLGNISNKAYNSVDIAVLGFFVSPGLIGIYSVVWSVAAFLSIFGRSIEGTLFPEMSKTADEHGVEAIRELTGEALQYAGLFTIPGLIGGLIVGDRLLRIYGPSFEKGSAVLGLLVGATLVYSYVRQLRNTLNAANRPDLAFRTNGAFIGANLVLNVVLVAEFGWIGAAVATLLSAAIGAVLAYWYVKSIVGIALPLASLGRQWLAALVMGVLIIELRRLGERYPVDSNAVFVVGLVSVGAVVYFAVLVAIWPDFREKVATNLPTDRLPG